MKGKATVPCLEPIAEVAGLLRFGAAWPAVQSDGWATYRARQKEWSRASTGFATGPNYVGPQWSISLGQGAKRAGGASIGTG